MSGVGAAAVRVTRWRTPTVVSAEAASQVCPAAWSTRYTVVSGGLTLQPNVPSAPAVASPTLTKSASEARLRNRVSGAPGAARLHGEVRGGAAGERGRRRRERERWLLGGGSRRPARRRRARGRGGTGRRLRTSDELTRRPPRSVGACWPAVYGTAVTASRPSVRPRDQRRLWTLRADRHACVQPEHLPVEHPRAAVREVARHAAGGAGTAGWSRGWRCRPCGGRTWRRRRARRRPACACRRCGTGRAACGSRGGRGRRRTPRTSTPCS